MPERETTPTEPCLKMLPGMMPILHWFGVSTPGQLGPIRRDFEPDSERFTLIMSSTGMPSVMQTISGDLGVDRFQDRVGGEGRRHIDRRWRRRRSCATASATVSNTGRPRWVWPPLPGETPPTILVP